MEVIGFWLLVVVIFCVLWAVGEDIQLSIEKEEEEKKLTKKWS